MNFYVKYFDRLESLESALSLRCIQLEVDSCPKLKVIQILTRWYLIANTVKNLKCIICSRKHFFSTKNARREFRIL